MFKWFRKCEHEWKYLDETIERIGKQWNCQRVTIITCFCPKCRKTQEVTQKAWKRYLRKCQIIEEYEKQNKE
ncbi:hypothetical protein CN434_25410 [Bacillus thuringiensis]|nr:hypothetical protein CN434_25410 [Bacillus thuringiensis]